MKILTALQDPKTNEILKEKTKHNIIETDIQYQEGILETLEKNNKIDLIIISQLLPGNIGFKDLINKIKIINNNIEIIAILENKNNELKDFLKQKNINSIFYNNEITIDELINVIEEKDKNKKEMEINKEIKLLKEIILENNKKIEQKFIINYEDLIKDFLSNIKGDNRYDFCVKLRNKFTPDEIYNIELMLPEERNAYLKKTLSEEEYKVYEIYLASNKFNMEDFIDYLNRLIELNDPTVVVLVPNDKVNYDYIDKNIKTKVSDGIYKGIKILYRNKVYDFSLNEGNV